MYIDKSDFEKMFEIIIDYKEFAEDHKSESWYKEIEEVYEKMKYLLDNSCY